MTPGMAPGGRLWRVDLAAIVVATAVVGLFIASMAVEQILPQVGDDTAAGARTRGTVAEPDCHQGIVALSFDGGPDPDVTGPLIDLLHRKEIAATFYVEVDRAVGEAALFRKLAFEGHPLGVYLPPGITGAAARTVIDRGRTHFAVNGVRPLRLLRPDEGRADDEVRLAVAEAGLALVGETDRVDVGDRSLAAPATIEKRILDNLRPGVTFVAHDAGVPGLNSLAAMTTMIDEIQNRGYCFGLAGDAVHGRDLVAVRMRRDQP